MLDSVIILVIHACKISNHLIMLMAQKDSVLLAVKDGTQRKLLLATPEMDIADVRLHLCFILIYIACSLKYGKGALECTEFVVTKCRAILTNPRNAVNYEDSTPEAGTTAPTVADQETEAGTYPYCGDVETEYSYGGCHTSCKSCIETYTRNGFTVGPAYNSAAAPADYSYGNAKNCYECHDGYYQIPAITLY